MVLILRNLFNYKKAAFSGIGFIAAIFIFGIALFITMEYYHIFTVKESVETDISRALNISVTMAVQDMDWVQHNSVMDTEKAQREFKTYLTEDMKLNNDYEKYADDGSFQYQIIIDKSDIQKSPAKYSIDGRIRMQPVTVRSILPKTFDIPFKLSSNNIRTDY